MLPLGVGSVQSEPVAHCAAGTVVPDSLDGSPLVSKTVASGRTAPVGLPVNGVASAVTVHPASVPVASTTAYVWDDVFVSTTDWLRPFRVSDQLRVAGAVRPRESPSMALSSRVTAPSMTSARPWMTAPVAAVIDVRARMLPAKVEPDPSVAVVLTCQKTSAACAPSVSTTWLADAVTRPAPS